MITKVKMTKNMMFPTFLQAETLFSLKTIIEDSNWLWHLRFGHLNFRGLNLVVQKNMVARLPMIDIPDCACEGCLIGKQDRNSFPIGRSRRAKQPLELVHIDICDPGKVKSQYILTFINDFTRKRLIIFF